MNQDQIIIYQSVDGSLTVDVILENDTLWLSLHQLANLFERDKSVISRHLSNIFKEGELVRDSVVAKNATTASDGKTYLVEYFNLDAVISVGYHKYLAAFCVKQQKQIVPQKTGIKYRSMCRIPAASQQRYYFSYNTKYFQKTKNT